MKLRLRTTSKMPIKRLRYAVGGTAGSGSLRVLRQEGADAVGATR